MKILKTSAYFLMIFLWSLIVIYTVPMTIFFSLAGMIQEEPGLMAGYISVALVSTGGLAFFFLRNYRRTGELV